MPRGTALTNWNKRKRGDWPLMTRPIWNALIALSDAKAAEQPFIALDLRANTARALVNRDWAFRSDGLDGVRWTITGRGERALKVYSPVMRRGDGLCPNCGLRPFKTYSTGTQENYCDDCYGKMSKKKRRQALKSRNRRADRERRQARLRAMLAAGNHPICSRPDCDRPVHVQPSRVLDWCEAHWKAYMNSYNDRRRSGKGNIQNANGS